MGVLKFMSPHLMMTLGASVSGSVDGDSYDANWLCDGDLSFPIKTTSGSASFTITGTSVSGINGVVVANHNLDEGASISFSGGVTASILAPEVPPNDIRLNAWDEITPVSASGCSFSVSGNSAPVIVGEVLVGQFQTIRLLPPGSDSDMRMFQVPYSGEYGGLSYDRGAESRSLSGTVYVRHSEKILVDAWFRACRNNSLPSVIIPFEHPDVASPGSGDTDQDAWVVIWDGYNPRPYVKDIWALQLGWTELPRYRWP